MVETEEFKKLEEEANKVHLEMPDLISYEQFNTFGYVLERIEDLRNKLKNSNKFYNTELQECYEKGLDAGKNGSNTTNTHFSIFSSAEKKTAWEIGKKEGDEYK